jgi:hypothetical protein
MRADSVLHPPQFRHREFRAMQLHQQDFIYMVGIIFMQRTNGGGDVADEINSFIAMSAAAIDR